MKPSVTPLQDAESVIAAGRIEFAQGGRRMARLVSLAATTLVALMMVPLYPDWVPLSWFVGGLGLIALRRLTNRRLDGGLVTRGSLARWQRNILGSAVAYGLLWSLSGVLFARSGDPLEMAVAVAVVVAAVVGGLWMVSVRRAFLTYALIVTLPTCVVIAWSSDPLRVGLGCMLLLSCLSVVRLGDKLQQIIVDTLRLRVEKDQALQRLTLQSDRLEASNREKLRFIAAASHDLRQPMQALTMFFGALDRHVSGIEGHHLLRRTGQSLQALNDLFDALLDVSRLDAGQVPMVHEPVPLGPLFEQLRDQFAAAANERGLRFRVVSTDAWVRSDPVQLRRIVGNLLSNAIKFTDRGSVCLLARRSGAALRIEVRDSGPGIAPAQQESVFREFYQLGNPERDRRKGIGLGLAIVQRIALSLDHELQLRSAVGRGSVFSVTVPRLAPMPQEAVAPVPEAAPLTDGLIVLVVDDESDVREGIVTLLQRWGCEAWLADGRQTALAVSEAYGRAPDVALCDFRLRGGETGIEVVAALRERWGLAIPAALISGEEEPASLARVRAAGLTLLRKPVRPAALRALIGMLMRRVPGGSSAAISQT